MQILTSGGEGGGDVHTYTLHTTEMKLLLAKWLHANTVRNEVVNGCMLLTFCMAWVWYCLVNSDRLLSSFVKLAT